MMLAFKLSLGLSPGLFVLCYWQVVSSLGLSSTEKRYKIVNLGFDKPGRCHVEGSLEFSSVKEWNGIYWDTESRNTPEPRRLIAIEDHRKVFLLAPNSSEVTLSNEFLIAEFDAEIIHVEPKWVFDRFYVVTKRGIYEIDFLSWTITRLVTFANELSQDSGFLMTADPFHGTVTYLIGRLVFVQTVNYPDTSWREGEWPRLATVTDSFLNDRATCQKCGDRLKFLTSSSQIEGFHSVQTHYLVSESSLRSTQEDEEYFRLIVDSGTCRCFVLKSPRRKEFLQKIYWYSNASDCFESPASNSSPILFENKKSNFNESIFEFKKCLRICQTPRWRHEIYSLYGFEVASQRPVECVNSLRLNSSMEEFGIGLIKEQDSHQYRLLVQFYPEFIEQLVTSECSGLEIMFKFMVKFRSIDELTDLNAIWDEQLYQKVSTSEALVNLTLDRDSMYEINAYIQTPFDARPLLVGTFVLERNVRVNRKFFEPEYQKLLVKESPHILALNWPECISSTFVYASFFKNSQFRFASKNISYLLTNIDSNLTIRQNTDEFKYIATPESTNFSLDLVQVVFKVDNLTENTKYRLRIVDSTNSGEISSVSSTFVFKTLRIPLIRVVSVREDSVRIRVNIECRSRSSSDVDDIILKPSSSEDTNYLFRILIFATNASNWNNSYERFLQEADFSSPSGGHPAYKLYSSEIEIRNLNSSATYWIKLEHEVSVVSDEFYAPPHVLTSNVVKFSTLEAQSDYFKTISMKLVVIGAIILLLLLLLSLIAVYRSKKKRKWFIKAAMNKKGADLSKEEIELLSKINPNLLYSANSAENKMLTNELKNLRTIDESEIELMNIIGKGAFGEVFKGKLKQNKKAEITVAIKKLRNNAERHEKLDLVKEAISLSKFNHPNLINFYGILLNEAEEPIYIILEYMNMGDLLSYLRKSRSNKMMSYADAVKICIDVASGCCYLEKNNFVHRDIAARNCLVNVDEYQTLEVKIGDFGLAREIYSMHYYKQANDNKLLPIRWMAPEAIIDGLFTIKSDVWSFGILMWEILTLGYQPYPGMDNQEVIEHVKSGGTLEITSKCPIEMKNILVSCWNIKSCNRPSFSEILDELTKIGNEKHQIVVNSDVLPIYDDFYALSRA